MIASALFSLLSATAAWAATATDLAYVKANFENAGLSTVFPDFAPSAVLEASFGSSKVEIGQPVTQATAGSRPDLTLDGGPSFTPDGKFTFVLADANIVGWSAKQNLHWLTNGVSLANNAPDFSSETAIRSYAGPGPAEGSGAHRYVLAVYAQPADFAAPAGFDATIDDVREFDLNDYVASGKLTLVAANYFTVENGQATVSVSATSAVDAATLSAPASSGAASAASSGAASSSAAASSGSASASSSAASSAASSPASADATPSAQSGATALLPSLAVVVAGTLLALL